MQVPQLLRDAGFRLTTMREHYGETQAQSVSDHKWIAMTAECGWIGFHKAGARLFCVPRADILAEQVAARYIASLAAIARAARFPGPFIYTVHPSKIVRVL